jgi:hypothetical protein
LTAYHYYQAPLRDAGHGATRIHDAPSSGSTRRVVATSEELEYRWARDEVAAAIAERADAELFDAVRRWFDLCARYTVALANGDGGRAEAIQLRLTANRGRIDALIESRRHLRESPDTH